MSFEDDFRFLVSRAHTPEGASILSVLRKEYDLRDEQYRSAVEQIALWIDSPDEDFRREVTLALCVTRPVPGYEHIAVVGWEKAPDGDLHWYGAAIKCCYRDGRQVNRDLVRRIVSRIFTPTPRRERFSCANDYCDALEAWHAAAADCMDVIRHFAGLCGLARDSATGEQPFADAVDWRLLAALLHRVGLEEC